LLEAVSAGRARQPNHSQGRRLSLADPPDETESLRTIRQLAPAKALTPLLWAVFHGDIEALRLLESGADANVRPNPSDLPLWHAEDDFGLTEYRLTSETLPD
jgi:ankyrin repeat protein